MSAGTATRFDGASEFQQAAMMYEIAVLQLAGFSADVVPPGSTGASIVNAAWAKHARYRTYADIRDYALQMVEVAEQFQDALDNDPTIIVFVQNAHKRNKRVMCRMHVHDKLQVAIETYTKAYAEVCIAEMEYDNVPFDDKRVYVDNTPFGLGMHDYQVIYVAGDVDKQGASVGSMSTNLTKICISGAEALIEVSYVDYTYSLHQSFDMYAQKFCNSKGLDASKVRFMHAGCEIQHDQGATLRTLTHFDSSTYVRKPGPMVIYVHPRPEFMSDPDQCFVPGECPEEQEHALQAAASTRVLRSNCSLKHMEL